MGLLVDGVWQDQWYDTKATDGKFVRSESQFRNWVTADGGAGVTGKGGFKAEPGRYHLYVSLACPWAHRTLIFRQLKGLQDMIDVAIVSPYMHEQGWTFKQDFDLSTALIGDHLYGMEFMHQIYTKADPHYSGRVTVPVLWDKQQQTIVSNESADIIRMFNSAFDDVGACAGDYYPQALRAEIDGWNEVIYDHINNGVYKAGFATTQAAYEDAFEALFAHLDKVEAHLSQHRYLLGAQITEADWRLLTTLLRFDAVYVGHFKCNLKRIVDYPHLWGYVRDLYQQPGVSETLDIPHIKHHYYASHASINPTAVVPIGPSLHFDVPHQRGGIAG